MWHSEKEFFPIKYYPSSVNQRNIFNSDKLRRSSVIPLRASLLLKYMYITCPQIPYLFQTYTSLSLFIISIMGWHLFSHSQINISILPGIEDLFVQPFCTNLIPIIYHLFLHNDLFHGVLNHHTHKHPLSSISLSLYYIYTCIYIYIYIYIYIQKYHVSLSPSFCSSL